MAHVYAKAGFDSDPLSSSSPPSSPVASEKDLFTPLSSPPRALHSSSPTRPKNDRLYSGIDESSNPTNPNSAFYQHPTTRWSLQQAQSKAAMVDLEAGLAALPAKEATHNLSSYSSRTHLTASDTDEDNKTLVLQNSSSSIWPTKQELQQKELVQKKADCRRKWNFIGAMDKKQRLWVKILIALIIVAAAVGIGVGISRAVGAGVYEKNGQQSAPLR